MDKIVAGDVVRLVMMRPRKGVTRLSVSKYKVAAVTGAQCTLTNMDGQPLAPALVIPARKLRVVK